MACDLALSLCGRSLALQRPAVNCDAVTSVQTVSSLTVCNDAVISGDNLLMMMNNNCQFFIEEEEPGTCHSHNKHQPTSSTEPYVNFQIRTIMA